ncbi:hypothetical protein ACSMXN_02145 [Jatrophihabitans sp. DSM 45814]
MGDLAPSVYWFRRILLVAALVLVGLSAYAAFRAFDGKSTATAASSSLHTTSPPPTPTSHGASTVVSTSSKASVKPTSSAPAVPVAPVNCTPAQLTITASTNAPTYVVGATPELALVVTNKGPRPCIADLSDAQIELRVFSGSARIWGSHDCQVEPGTSKQTLPVGRPTTRVIEWSGLSSMPGCAGVRQRVPAGTYTLFALLSGQQGKPATFAFTDS